VILRRHRGAAPIRNRRTDHRIHGVTTLAGDGDEGPCHLLWISDRLRTEPFEHRWREEHDASVVTDDQTGGVLVGELRIEGKPERGPEVHRAREIRDREIQEEHAGHDIPLGHAGVATAIVSASAA
jgi:hypothetical protein